MAGSKKAERPASEDVWQHRQAAALPFFELDGALKAAAAEYKSEMLFLWPVFDANIQTEKG